MNVLSVAISLDATAALDVALALLPPNRRLEVEKCPVIRGRNGRRFGSAQTRRFADGSVAPVKITLHPALLTAPALREKLADTFLHEAAHLIAELLFAKPRVPADPFAFRRPGPSSAGHGPVWKHVMRTMGLDPARLASHEDALLLAQHSPPRRKRVC